MGSEVLILGRFDTEGLGEGYGKLVKDVKEGKGKKLRLYLLHWFLMSRMHEQFVFAAKSSQTILTAWDL